MRTATIMTKLSRNLNNMIVKKIYFESDKIEMINGDSVEIKQ